MRWQTHCWVKPILAPGREALVEAIARESAGNPFFVAELVRHVQSDDVAAGTGWSSPDPSPFRSDSAASIAFDGHRAGRCPLGADPAAPRGAAARAGDHRRLGTTPRARDDRPLR